MRTKLYLLITCYSLFSSIIKAQTFHFPLVSNPAGCTYTYELLITVRIDSVKVTNVYFDDGINGSFAYEAYVSYQNIFANSTLPAGNFFTYDISAFSDNPNLSPNSITNNIGTVPLQTTSAGGFASQNNPTFNGSATARSLVVGGVYSDPAILAELGYDSATIHINLPCKDTTMGTTDMGTLPVIWSELRADVSGFEVLLSWQTFTEQNNLGFYIEKSRDGFSWQNLGFIPTKAVNGNSDQQLAYQYKTTEQATGNFLYRVIQKDIDGRTVHSNIANASIAERNKNNLVIYPNPSTHIIYLKQIANNTPFTIFDNYGRNVLSGKYNSHINISRLQNGVYWIRVKNSISRFVLARD